MSLIHVVLYRATALTQLAQPSIHRVKPLLSLGSALSELYSLDIKSFLCFDDHLYDKLTQMVLMVTLRGTRKEQYVHFNQMTNNT